MRIKILWGGSPALSDNDVNFSKNSLDMPPYTIVTTEIAKKCGLCREKCGLCREKCGLCDYIIHTY